MIKIERNYLDLIAQEYFSLVMNIRTNTRNEIYLAFEKKLEKYILAPLNSFDDLSSEFNLEFKDKINEFNSSKKKINTDYGKFVKFMMSRYETVIEKLVLDKGTQSKMKLGTWLAKTIGMKTCPYCNRQYTFTIYQDKEIRPQFDHFYPKSKFPYFALSFYNLIPACPTCNQLKRDKTLKILYPYKEGFEDKCMFRVNQVKYMMEGEINVDFDIKTHISKEEQTKCQNSIETFALKELYNEHVDYVQEIIDKAYMYNDSYYDGLVETFSGMEKTPQEIQQLIFGNYVALSDNEKRPLSKLTRDLLNQIGIK
jgi:hypothetical protein